MIKIKEIVLIEEKGSHNNRYNVRHTFSSKYEFDKWFKFYVKE